MWVIIDWTDTQVIGPFESERAALKWVIGKHLSDTSKDWTALDHYELSVHQVKSPVEAKIRWDA